MKNLASIITAIQPKTIYGSLDKDIKGLALDSRLIQQDFIFAATTGSITNGHLYIDNAISLGATVVLCEFVESPQSNITYLWLTIQPNP